MGFNLDEDNPIPTAQDSEDMIAQDGVRAAAYLRRMGQVDLAPALGLSAYV